MADKLRRRYAESRNMGLLSCETGLQPAVLAKGFRRVTFRTPSVVIVRPPGNRCAYREKIAAYLRSSFKRYKEEGIEFSALRALWRRIGSDFRTRFQNKLLKHFQTNFRKLSNCEYDDDIRCFDCWRRPGRALPCL